MPAGPALRKIVGVVRGEPARSRPQNPGLRRLVHHRPLDGEPGADADVAAVWMLWVDDVAGVDLSSFSEAYLVDERVAWDYEVTWPEGSATPGVKGVTFLRARQGITRREFARHWREVHTDLARVHHPALWRYVQNVVVEPLTPATPDDVDGVAELSFRSREDLTDRMYDSEEGRRIVAEDVRRFIDVRASWRVLTEEQVLDQNAF